MTNGLIAQTCLLQRGRVERAILSAGVWIGAEDEVQESILCDGVHIAKLDTASWLIIAFGEMVSGMKLPTLRRGHTHEWMDKN